MTSDLHQSKSGQTHSRPSLLHRLVDYLVTTGVLLLIGAVLECIKDREEIEKLIAIQDDLYRFVNSLQPFTIWNSFWKHFSSDKLSIFGPIRLVEALWATFRDILSIDNGLSVTALALGIFIGVSICFLFFRLLITANSWSVVFVLDVFKLLVWTPLAVSVVYFVLKQIMLVSLLTLSWVTHLAAILVVASPFIYLVFFKNLEHSVTERLIDYARHMTYKPTSARFPDLLVDFSSH